MDLEDEITEENCPSNPRPYERRTRPMTAAEYLSGDSCCCPACGSFALLFEITEVNLLEKDAWTGATCKDCSSTWNVIWKLTGFNGLSLRLRNDFRLGDGLIAQGAWHRALERIFTDNIGNNIQHLVSAMRDLALQNYWSSSGTELSSYDEPVGDRFCDFEVALGYAIVPKSHLYEKVALLAVADIKKQIWEGGLRLAQPDEQKELVDTNGYKIFLSLAGRWLCEEQTGLRVLGAFVKEEEAVEACYLLQLALK